MEKLINSIQIVRGALEKNYLQKIERQEQVNLRLIHSLNNVVEEVKRFDVTVKINEAQSSKRENENAKKFELIIDEIVTNLNIFFADQERKKKETHSNDQNYISAIKTISEAVLKNKKSDVDHLVSKETLFSFLDKARDENFHSDYISSLLNKELMGEFSEQLFSALINGTSSLNESISTKRLHTYRERRLDTLNENLKNTKAAAMGARRIDILTISTSHVLIIENKLYTFEHDDQTIDYYKAAEVYCSNLVNQQKKVIAGIMLSPSGLKASHSQFQSMTYCDLFIILKNLRPIIKEQHALNFLDLYLDSLYLHFFQKDKSYSEYLTNYWRNYDVKLKAV